MQPRRIVNELTVATGSCGNSATQSGEDALGASAKLERRVAHVGCLRPQHRPRLPSLAWLTLSLLALSTAHTFGQAGTVDATYSIRADPHGRVWALALQPDGKAIVAGEFRILAGADRNFVCRLNTDGTPDAQFVADLEPYAEARTVALQPDGRILVGGDFYDPNVQGRRSVVRLNSDGTRDTNFDSSSANLDRVRDLVVQPDGRVLVSWFGLLRLQNNGTQDTNFAAAPEIQQIESLALQADGKILVAGVHALDSGLLRLYPDGSLDTNFAAPLIRGEALLLPDSQSILVSGTFTNQDGTWRSGLARLRLDGSLDRTFDSSLALEGHIWAMAMQTNRSILVAGSFDSLGGIRRDGLARLRPDGGLDRSFDAGEIFVGEVIALAVQPDQRILIGGDFRSVGGVQRTNIARLFNDAPGFAGRFEFLAASNNVNEAEGSIVIPVQRFAGSTGTATVNFATTFSGSATAGSDFGPRTGTLTFAAGQISNSFTIPIIDDQQVEGYPWLRAYPQFESFGVVLSAPTGGAILGSQSTAVAVVLDDDTSIGFEFSSVSASEAAGQAVLAVVRSGLTNAAVSAQYETRNGTAIAPADYTPQSGSVNFAAGETQKLVLVLLADDDLVEGEERFSIALSNPAGSASISVSNAVVSVADDVSILEFGALRFSVAETDGFATIRVQRRGRTNNLVGVHLTTSNLTALAGSDYVASSGIVNFAPGETSASFAVPITDDMVVEDREQFRVTLSNPTGAAILGFSVMAEVDVTSDDGPGYPDTRFRPEVRGGRVNQLAQPPGAKILVRGERLFPNGTVFARYDLDGSPDTSFQPDLSADLYSFAVAADNTIFVSTGFGVDTGVRRLLPDGSLDRSFDTFFVDYTAGGFIPSVQMVVQVDGKLILSAYPARYFGRENATNVLNRLHVDGSYDTTFHRPNSADGQSLTAPPSALALQADGKLLMAASFSAGAGQRHGLVRLTEAGEYDPTFLFTETGSTIHGITVLADGRIVITGAFTNVNGVPRNYVARLNSDGSLDSSFDPPFLASFGFGSYISALVAQPDYKLIVAGDTAAPNVPHLGIGRLLANGRLDLDFRHWPDRVWSMAFQADGEILLGTSPQQTGELGNQGLVRLHNEPNLGAGSLEFLTTEYRVSETNSNLTLAVRRSGGSNGAVHVRYGTGGGTAQSDADYSATSGLITFGAGEIGERTITIPIHDDRLAEGDETFVVRLGQPIGGAVWGQIGTVTVVIVEDDTDLEFADTDVRVGEAGHQAFLTVRRHGATNKLTRVTFATSNGQAFADFDFLPQETTLTFHPGETNKAAAVPILEDGWGEADENFFVTLYNPTGGATIGSNATTMVTIEDNDRPGSLDSSLVASLLGTGPGGGAARAMVKALAVQPDGKIIIGGGFTEVAGASRRGIARLHRDGSLDRSFDPGLGVELFDQPGSVDALILQPDGKVIIAGQFTECHGASRWSLARLNSDGSLDSSFDAGLVAMDEFPFVAPVYALALQGDGSVLFGGGFRQVDTMELPGLARLDANGFLDYTFMPDTNFGPAVVYALGVQPEGTVLVGGDFDFLVQGSEFHDLARFNADGSLDTNFVPGTRTDGVFGHTEVRALLVQGDGRIVVGGAFVETNTLQRGIVRLNPDGSLDSTFRIDTRIGPDRWSFFIDEFGPVCCLASSVSALALQPDGKLLIGGRFTEVAGVNRTSLARLNSDGALDMVFDSRQMQGGSFSFGEYLPPSVLAMGVQPDGKILIGGDFTGLNGIRRDGFARLYGGDVLSFRSIERLSNGHVRLRVLVPVTHTYVLEVSTELQRWLPVQTRTVPAGVWEVLDDGAVSAGHRFYRVTARP